MGSWPPPPPGPSAVSDVTAADVIKSALRMIGALRPGQSPSGSELTDCLFNLNRMLELWSTQNLAVYQQLTQQHLLTAGKADYTIGYGQNELGDDIVPDFPAERPVSIVRAAIAGQPLEIADASRWSAIADKAYTGTPTALYSDRGYPLSTLYLWPVPNAAVWLELVTQEQLLSFADATKSVTLPTGYLEAIRYNLAIRLAPEWDKVARQDVYELARQSLADIKRLNAPKPVLECDPALLMQRPFDIYSGR